MRYFRIAFIFGLALMIFMGCSKEEIQPDPLNPTDEAFFKGSKVKNNKMPVPFKAEISLKAYFMKYGPIYQIDMEDDWVFPDFPPTITGGMHIEIKGKGNASHMGKMTVDIVQWWTRLHPNPPTKEVYFSYGQGATAFVAANGDSLFATYWGWADHRYDDDGTEILTHGTFTGGTGRFEGASGTFLWDGLFMKDFMPIPPNHPEYPPTPAGTEFGSGNVTVTGSIIYRHGPHGKGKVHDHGHKKGRH